MMEDDLVEPSLYFAECSCPVIVNRSGIEFKVKALIATHVLDIEGRSFDNPPRQWGCHLEHGEQFRTLAA
ncbi:MAG: hypothetical protein EHM48_07965, partial [Planctomycetaceae bacterium]